MMSLREEGSLNVISELQLKYVNHTVKFVLWNMWGICRCHCGCDSKAAVK